MIDEATLAFGDKYLEYLIATEIVSRGTGPAKFVEDGKNIVVCMMKHWPRLIKLWILS